MEFYDKVAFLNILADNVKKFRELHNLTQKELARGICSQAQISNLENKIDVPSAFILYKLCIRLGISLEHLIETSFSGHYLKVQEIEEKMEQLIDDYKWKELEELIESNSILLLNGTSYDKCLYYLGIITSISLKSAVFESTKLDTERAYKLLEDAKLVKLDSNPILALRIYTVIMGINIRNMDFNEANNLAHYCIDFISKINRRRNYRYIIPCYVNIAITNNYLGQFDIAKMYANLIKELCEKYKTALHLDKVYGIIAYQYNPLKGTAGDRDTQNINREMAEYYLRKAISVCEALGNNKQIEFYRNQLEANKK